jgi:hypothetical protein
MGGMSGKVVGSSKQMIQQADHRNSWMVAESSVWCSVIPPATVFALSASSSFNCRSRLAGELLKQANRAVNVLLFLNLEGILDE